MNGIEERVFSAGTSKTLHSVQNTDNRKDKQITEISLEILKKTWAEQLPDFSIARKFTILFTGDIHSHLEPTVASFVSEKPLGGVVRRVEYFARACKELDDPVLLLDAGDFLQGTPYFEIFQGEPDIQFMNMAGYHIVTVGNHDFDKGWEHLEKLLKAGKFNTLCANIFADGEIKPCLAPYSLLKIHDRFIAVVGIMGLDAWQSISPTMRKNLRIEDPIKVLDQTLPQLHSYVDLVILLSHSGIKDDRIFAEHPLVDIVIGGHSHTWMQEQEIIEKKVNEIIKKTPIFHGFRYGQLVAKMEVVLENGDHFYTKSSVEYLDERFDPKEDLVPSTTLLKKYQALMDEKLQEALGECVEALPSKDKMHRLIPLGEAVAEVLRKAGQADVGVIPSGAIKVGIEKGPFTIGTVHEMLAHEEPLWVVTMKGQLLLQLMQEGQKRWGLPRTFQYSGINLDIRGSVINNATIREKPLDPSSSYTVAGPSFFFEREIMDNHSNIKTEIKDLVESIQVKEKDLRSAFLNVIKMEGLGRWVVSKHSLHS